MLSLRNESHDRSNEVSSSLYQLISLVNIPVVHIPTRENPIVNRLNKTKVEKEVDHEQERADRLKAEATARRIEAQARASLNIFLATFLNSDVLNCSRRQRLNWLWRRLEKQRKQHGHMTVCSAVNPSLTRVRR